MPIQFDIQTDELYLEGIEKGIEKGVEKQQHDTVVEMLRDGVLPLEKVARYAGVTVNYVKKVQKDLEKRPKHGR